MMRETILQVITRFMLPFILLFALYVQFHGDFGPGGGFQAGVIFAAGIILYAMIWGPRAAQRIVPPGLARSLAALGVLVYAGTGLATVLMGGHFLDYSRFDPTNPPHGQHLGILLVELGVGVAVSNVMILIFYGFAGRENAE
jgi:multicomponent Na+:H+ antiporter subunit B